MLFRSLTVVLFSNIIISLGSCTEPREMMQSASTSFVLEPAGADTFLLDSVTRVGRSDFYYHRYENTEYLVVHNSYAFGQVEVYDYKTRKKINRIILDREGPDGIGAWPSGLYMHTPDSVFLFFNLGQRLVLVNSQGKIIANYGSIRPADAGPRTPYIEVSAIQPAFKYGPRLFFCTYEPTHQHTTSGAAFNLHARTTVYPFDLPPVYQSGWWAGIVYDRYFQTYNPDEKLIVQAYGNDHNIYVLDVESGEKNRYPAKSKYLAEQLRPFSKTPGDFVVEEQRLYRHAAFQGSYSTIKYDAWRKVYYRFVCRPVTPENYRTPSDTWSRMSVIILDNQFRHAGETDIPENLNWYQSVVTPKGLCFFSKKVYAESEDQMVLVNFRLKSQ